MPRVTRTHCKRPRCARRHYRGGLCRQCHRTDNPIPVEDCAHLYRCGVSVGTLADQYGHAREAITDALRASNVTLRTRAEAVSRSRFTTY
jgi:hypothetical protein